jgi:hypothetical protein
MGGRNLRLSFEEFEIQLTAENQGKRFAQAE